MLDGPKTICNNQGRCNCGQCVCNDPNRISGKYCECDNESCDRYLSVVCAGNGRCDCGICKCYDGWTKSDCSCSSNNSSCVTSKGVSENEFGNLIILLVYLYKNLKMFNFQLICNGKGQCVCGKCVCNEDSGYFGPMCEDCPVRSYCQFRFYLK